MGVHALKVLLLPPAGCFLVALAGWLVARRWRRCGRAMMLAGAAALFLLSLPGTGSLLLASLQDAPALDPAAPLPGADAIVVLSAETLRDAPEYGGASVGPFTLVRLRYAAELQRRCGRPVLVTGARLDGLAPSTAALMAQALRREFQVPVEWVEETARNTHENAERSAAILLPAGVRTVYLVTHAWHLRRARDAFEKAGLAVVPAPTAFEGPPPASWQQLVPSWRGLGNSALALHEWLGIAWYGVVYRGGGGG